MVRYNSYSNLYNCPIIVEVFGGVETIYYAHYVVSDLDGVKSIAVSYSTTVPA